MPMPEDEYQYDGIDMVLLLIALALVVWSLT